MDIGNLGSSHSRSVSYAWQGYGDLEPMNPMTTSTRVSSSSRPKWKMLWRKFQRENKKMFESWSRLKVDGAPYYDEYTHSQNFDQGLAWNEPDSLSRSFSVRFARSSGIA